MSLVSLACVVVLAMAAPPQPAAATTAGMRDDHDLAERPAPPGSWRMVRLQRCAEDVPLPPAVAGSLASAADLVRHGNGADGVTELELCLQEHGANGSVQLTLAQLYILAARGRTDLMPDAGPAAARGKPAADRERCLSRALDLLKAARMSRPDDAVVDYLTAEVWRAREDLDQAATWDLRGMRKCSYVRSLEMVRLYQHARAYPAALVGDLTPVDPPASGRHDVAGGVVVLDLLVDPEGRVAQVVGVQGPPSLVAAAGTAARKASYQAARIGVYPVWSWLRVSVPFAGPSRH